VVVLLLVPAAPAQNLAVTHQQQQLQQLQPHSRRQLAAVVAGASASRVAPGHLAVSQHPLPQHQLLGCPQLPLPSQEASKRRSAAAAPPPQHPRERRLQKAGAPAATQQQREEEVDRGPPCSPTSHRLAVPSKASGLCLSSRRCPTAPASKPTAAAVALAFPLAHPLVLSQSIRACHLPTGLCAMPLEGPSSRCH
jgi:hypothetical protein